MDKDYNRIYLDTEIQYLKGVGPKRGAVLKSFGINNIQELLRNFPRKYLDRTNVKLINQIQIGEKVVIVGDVVSFGLKRLKKGNFFQLVIADSTGTLTCIWFHAVSWIIEKFKKGDIVDICVKDYLNLPKSFHGPAGALLGYRVPITFPKKKVEMDP